MSQPTYWRQLDLSLDALRSGREALDYVVSQDALALWMAEVLTANQDAITITPISKDELSPESYTYVDACSWREGLDRLAVEIY